MQVIQQVDLPVTRRLLELKAFTVMELGEVVVAWFERRTLCPPDEAAGIRQQLALSADLFTARGEYRPR